MDRLLSLVEKLEVWQKWPPLAVCCVLALALCLGIQVKLGEHIRAVFSNLFYLLFGLPHR